MDKPVNYSYLLLLKNAPQSSEKSTVLRGFTLFDPDIDTTTLHKVIDPVSLDDYKREYIAGILANPASNTIIDKDDYYNQEDPVFANDFKILHKLYPKESHHPGESTKIEEELPLHELIEQKKSLQLGVVGGRKLRKSRKLRKTKRKHRKSKKSRKHHKRR